MTDSKFYHYCYLIHDLDNGMKYFGVRSTENVEPEQDNYWGSGTKINEARKLKGKDQFKREVLQVFDTREEAMDYEEEYMAEHDCVDSPEYYNLSWKSTGGRFDYHDDLAKGLTSSPQEKNGAQKNFPKSLDAKKAPETAEEGFEADYTANQDGSKDGRIHHNGQMGGKRKGAGRPKGSKSIFSKQSVEKLQELGFDPIEELWRTYEQVCDDIENTKSISARTSLYNTRQKIMSELIKYGYRPVPRMSEEKKEVTVEEKRPMSIILTDMDSKTDEETKH